MHPDKGGGYHPCASSGCRKARNKLLENEPDNEISQLEANVA
ncbi:Uncharacterized protein dnm_007140 [Desulfonema magnum]|uniref:Uncharacterized protein n=1 Tax=Desulfonema magnum TaxID=45655 RepID=A0A975BGN4_9BACT|nr:Uncharacterized protein dnm_007140 [Desulfonema magnum]